MKEITKKYSEGDLTVIWQPHKCIHSEKCFRGLPSVFKPKEKPWIDPAAEPADIIRKQIQKCPSGALSYEGQEGEARASEDLKIEVKKNGPLLVHAPFILESNGENKKIESRTTAFCRCGNSSNKPYCDGTHRKVDFQD